MSTETPPFNLPTLRPRPRPRPPSHAHPRAAGPLTALLHSLAPGQQAGAGECQGLCCPGTGCLYRGSEGLCRAPTSIPTTGNPHSSNPGCHSNIVSGSRLSGCEKVSVSESRGRAEALLQRLPVAGHRHHDSGPDGVEAAARTAAHTQGEEEGKTRTKVLIISVVGTQNERLLLIIYLNEYKHNKLSALLAAISL